VSGHWIDELGINMIVCHHSVEQFFNEKSSSGENRISHHLS
jgi:hypothetical protein